MMRYGVSIHPIMLFYLSFLAICSIVVTFIHKWIVGIWFHLRKNPAEPIALESTSGVIMDTPLTEPSIRTSIERAFAHLVTILAYASVTYSLYFLIVLSNYEEIGFGMVSYVFFYLPFAIVVTVLYAFEAHAFNLRWSSYIISLQIILVSLTFVIVALK